MTKSTTNRDNRVPIMFSDDEIKLIDDFQFENRIRTRAEAIRRMIMIAKETHHNKEATT